MILSRKEIEVLYIFENGTYKQQGYKWLLEKGITKEEIDTLIEKLKNEEYLEEFEAPEGNMLCTLKKFDSLKKNS